MSSPITILGLNTHHPDAAACLLVDGEVVAAAEEERFRRVKHFVGFPTEAARFCLERAGLDVTDLDHIAVNRDPRANLVPKAWYALTHPGRLRGRLRQMERIADPRHELAGALGVEPRAIRARVHRVEHHRAHLASAYFCSPFRRSAVVSVDGFGDFTSTMWAVGRKHFLSIRDQIRFPHSLGHFYLALTQHLGFPNYGDEYKVMGLAAYGEPRFLREMSRVVKLGSRGRFALDLKYFRHHREDLSWTVVDGVPQFESHASEGLSRLIGPPRRPGSELLQEHKDLAASVQARYEQALFHLLRNVAAETDTKSVCLAGGCAMNSLANGQISVETPFDEVYVQAAAGDAGGAVGAAQWTWHVSLERGGRRPMTHAYHGPSYSDDEIASVLGGAEDRIEEESGQVERFDDDERLLEEVADAIANGAVVGWFSGGMEWGPRALGARSILADPRRADMQDILNRKIKRRESFRPFAPSILRRKSAEWFVQEGNVPFMSQVFTIRQDKRELIPAVTHEDGTGRLQTVTDASNPRFHRLIEIFFAKTGVPILLNTSFNENEPIVCRPEEALDCFLRTRMDLLVLGGYVVRRVEQEAPITPDPKKSGEERHAIPATHQERG